MLINRISGIQVILMKYLKSLQSQKKEKDIIPGTINGSGRFLDNNLTF